MHRSIRLTLFAFCTLIFAGCASKINHASKKPQVKNIILLIGDGMGLSQVSTAFFYKDTVPNFQRFNSIGLIKTSSASDLITDSAAGATAFSTGVKSYNGSIGMSNDTIPQKTIVEMVSESGMKTGIIATSSITHATPASFYAHVKSRELSEEIATWLPKSELDYFAAGGLKFFTKRSDKINYLKKLEDSGFIIETESLVKEKTLSKEKKHGFLLADDGMPKISEGRGSFLPDATSQAIKYLSKSENGFFLLIEGSQIDWGGHNNDANYIINEVKDFDKAIGVALDFAEKEGNTLVLVMADHETGGFTLASSTKTDTKGNIINDYNKIKPSFSTKGHSATLIPVFAFGLGCEQFSGIYENTEIFDKILKLLN
jgi:alkaline phosphatase